MTTLPIRTHSPLSRSTDSAANFGGLDIVRAFAAIAVVMLHACVPYLSSPMPGLVWPVRDNPSHCCDWMFWGIEIFIMPLFLIIAGFLAWQTLARRGSATLLRSRARRLLVPLAFATVFVLPLSFYVWALGWVTEGQVSLVKLRSLKFDQAIGSDLWGLSHLWFLLYLFLYVAVLAAASHWMKDLKVTARSRFISTSALAVSVLVLGTLILWTCPRVIWGFQHQFAPVPSKWLYNGLFFAVGCAIARFDPHWSRISQVAPRMVGFVAVIAMATVMLGLWHLEQTDPSTFGVPTQHGRVSLGVFRADHPFALAVLAMLTTASSLCVPLVVIGTSVARVRHVPTSVQYLAAASFWIYLTHHPLIGLCHVDLKYLAPELSPLVKAWLACGLATGTSLLSYEAFVRRTRFGQYLGLGWEFPDQAKDGSSSMDKPVVLPINPASDQDRRVA